jgi:heme/copper-type cytochrome/quinol oxidase subunit 2
MLDNKNKKIRKQKKDKIQNTVMNIAVILIIMVFSILFIAILFEKSEILNSFDITKIIENKSVLSLVLAVLPTIICIIMLIISVRFWYKYGKDYPKITKTVEFYPPEGYDAAEIGYVYKKQSDKKLTIATIISLAYKGYLKIEEVEKNKFLITNLYSKNNSLIDIKCAKLSTLEKKVYDVMTKDSDSFILGENQIFYNANKTVELYLNKFKKKIVENEEYKWTHYALATICLIGGFGLTIITFPFIKNAIEGPFSNLIVFFEISNIFTPFICAYIIYFFSLLMKRKRKNIENLISQVKGYKDFLEVAEKKQLEALVEKNPHYFYDILPYAYVLGVSNKWIKDFEKIKIPIEQDENHQISIFGDLIEIFNIVDQQNKNKTNNINKK